MTIQELKEQISHHQRLYYQGVPEISDEEFDALKARLKALEEPEDEEPYVYDNWDEYE